MNAYEKTKLRLANHAGMLLKGDITENLAGQLWIAERDSTRPKLEHVDDVVRCLAFLNTYFNGPDPNTRKGGPRAHPIPDDLSYFVSSIISSCLMTHRKWVARHLFPEDVLEDLLTGTARIAYCWEQLLASDISDLEEGFDLD